MTEKTQADLDQEFKRLFRHYTLPMTAEKLGISMAEAEALRERLCPPLRRKVDLMGELRRARGERDDQ